MYFTIGSLLLSLAIVALVILFLARPWLAPGQKPESVTQLEKLTYQKETLLAQIKQLDFDHEVGVIPEEEHQRLRLRLVTQAAAILQQLDAFSPATKVIAKPAPAPAVKARTKAQPAAIRKPKAADSALASQTETDIDAAIEAAVAKLRQSQNSSLQTLPVDGTILTCPQCNREVKADDRYCAGCGQPINQPSHA